MNNLFCLLWFAKLMLFMKNPDPKYACKCFLNVINNLMIAHTYSPLTFIICYTYTHSWNLYINTNVHLYTDIEAYICMSVSEKEWVWLKRNKNVIISDVFCFMRGRNALNVNGSWHFILIFLWIMIIFHDISQLMSASY